MDIVFLENDRLVIDDNCWISGNPKPPCGFANRDRKQGTCLAFGCQALDPVAGGVSRFGWIFRQIPAEPVLERFGRCDVEDVHLDAFGAGGVNSGNWSRSIDIDFNSLVAIQRLAP